MRNLVYPGVFPVPFFSLSLFYFFPSVTDCGQSPTLGASNTRNTKEKKKRPILYAEESLGRRLELALAQSVCYAQEIWGCEPLWELSGVVGLVALLVTIT